MKNFFSQILGSIALVVAGGLLLSLEVRAQQQAGPPPIKKEHSQKVADGLQKLKEYTDPATSNTPKAIELLDELLKIGEPGDSFDQAQLNLYKGNLMLPYEDARVAIPPLLKVLDITSRVDLLPAQDIKGVHKNLAIVYYVSLQMKDVTDAQKVTNIGKAIEQLESYFKLNGEPSADEAYQYASFLFTKATLGKEGDNIDLPTIKRAREAAQKGVLKDTRFRTDLYNLILTAHQYEKNAEASAEIMELLLARAPSAPESVRNWQILPHTYLGLANEMADKHDEDRANEFRFRAILAYERGHQYAGLFNGEKAGEDSTMDILNLSKTYYDVGQVEKGAEIMLEAVRAKKIKGDLGARAWGFVATYYQQLGKDDQAIAVLKEAASNFPQDGQFDFQLANTYYSLEQNDNAIKSIQEAARKGVTGRMPTVYLSQAYYLYSANRFKEASEAAAKGLAIPNVPANVSPQLKQLKEASDTAEAAKEAARSKL